MVQIKWVNWSPSGEHPCSFSESLPGDGCFFWPKVTVPVRKALSPVSITFTFCLSGLNGVLNSPLLPIPRGYFLWLFPIPHMPRIVPSVKHFKFSYLMLSSIFWKDPDWYVYKCVCIFGTYIVYPNNVNSQVMVTSIN